jgi:hypothetical protein
VPTGNALPEGRSVEASGWPLVSVQCLS